MFFFEVDFITVEVNTVYMSSNQAAEKWGVHVRVVQELCKNGRIDGASRLGREWMIPEEAEKPVDMRYKVNRRSTNGKGVS